jgi:hypothetical protein
MINELIQRVFCIRNISHLSHWRTKSYSQHVALGDFYDAVIDNLDSFIEQYQAAFGLINFKEDEKREEGEEKATNNLVPMLQEDVKWINKNRSKLANDVPALENKLDELVSVYLQAIYKLKFLS